MTFNFDKTSELQRQYCGDFTIYCSLNMLQKHQLELEKSKLLGGHVNPSDGLFGLSIILANLRIKIKDGPSWWKESKGGFTIEDEDILVALLNKGDEVEQEWKRNIIQKTSITPKE